MAAEHQQGRVDIPASGWVAAAPGWLRPYLRLARLDRSIGIWLLLWPCWWSLALAADGWPDPVLLLLFAVGALAMRGAGCCWNDIADRDLDGRVARTRTRPIPAGEISVIGAGVCMVALALAGLAVLLTLNRFAQAVGLISLAPVAIYPFMKRVTWWPQFFLGLAFNWGALLGYAAVRGELGWPALALYLGGIAWTLGYDTVYAHQDRDDDALIGVKSSALRLGRHSRPALALFYSLATAGFALAGQGLGWPFWLGLAGLALHFAWQTAVIDLDDPADCLAKFRANHGAAAILFVGIVAGRLAA
ncbi:MAG: 4-hydroxybenzoate octaprenyltransferase [Alphaproteobacteria bacterium]|nr:4-hydroxybenzoate octaprenyltransferase [Alphaproteobacteria bacterium]